MKNPNNKLLQHDYKMNTSIIRQVTNIMYTISFEAPVSF